MITLQDFTEGFIPLSLYSTIMRVYINFVEKGKNFVLKSPIVIISQVLKL